MLDQITPVLLTYNEAENIGRTLSNLSWARDIVAVDSGSTDETVAILTRHSNVRVFTHPFSDHATQWLYAVNETNISTPWILRLDADYQVTPALVEEMKTLDPGATIDAYSVDFDYAIYSRLLRASLYPPNTVLLRRGRFRIVDRAHTEGWVVDGPVEKLRARIVHDDWKSTRRWLMSQGHYMQRELARLETHRSGVRDWLRMRPPLAPLAVFFYCLFGKGLILDGRRGVQYALQRVVAEGVLALMLLEARLRKAAMKPGGKSASGDKHP